MTDRIPTRFAANGDNEPIPDTDPNGYLNWDLGYGFDYERRIGQDPNAKAVERLKMNWLFGVITDNLRQWQDQGYPDWRGTAAGTVGITYDVNAFVRYSVDKKVYRAKQAVPVNIAPTNATYWEEVKDLAYLASLSPMPAGAGNPANELISTPIDANTLATGTYEYAESAAGAANLPVANGGLMEVKKWLATGSTAVTVQRYISRTSGVAYIRYNTGSAWSSWLRQAAFNDVPAPRYLPPSVDFDTTVAGSYHLTAAAFTASTGTKPSGSSAGILEVLTLTGVTYQNFMDVSGNFLVRAKNGAAAFTSWVNPITTPKPGTLPEPIVIETTVNLNTFVAPGHYIQPHSANASTTANYPENGSAGSLIVKGGGLVDPEILGETKIQQEYHVAASTRVYVRSSTDSGWTAWAKAYNTENKPTPAEIGAVKKAGDTMTGGLFASYIIAQAGSSWAIDGGISLEPLNISKSYIAINGAYEALSFFSANRTAEFIGNVASNSPSPAAVNHLTRKDYVDQNFVKKAGDTVTGALTSIAADNWRIAYGGYGAYWRQDGSNLYLMLTNQGDPNGSYNNLRPLYVELGNGLLKTTTGLLLQSPQMAQGESATRKDYVDAQVNSRAPSVHVHTAAQGNSDIVAGGYGQIGTYVFAQVYSGSGVPTHDLQIGDAIAGSSLRPCAVDDDPDDMSSVSLSGTWKCLGRSHYGTAGEGNWHAAKTLWIRIS